MAYTRSEGTGEWPPIQSWLNEAHRMFTEEAARIYRRAKAEIARERRTPFPAEALEVE